MTAFTIFIALVFFAGLAAMQWHRDRFETSVLRAQEHLLPALYESAAMQIVYGDAEGGAQTEEHIRRILIARDGEVL